MTSTTAVRIGEAWRMHREGRNEDAVRAFQAVLQDTPDNVDAHYGIGLAYKALGQHDVAKKNFEQALVMTDKAEAARRVMAATEGRRDGEGEWNEPLELSYDHYLMMKRLIGQRLAEVSAAHK